MTGANRPVALVTGASRGIGADVARELAKGGYDLVLTARSLEPMQALAAELQGHAAATTIIAKDLSKPDAALSLAREVETRGIEIEVLVNNAGLAAIGRFDRSDLRLIGEMLSVNITALTELTRFVVPGMVARGSGKIMLVSSIAAFCPGPQMAVYFATKAYVLSFGEALAYELRGTGVTVTTVCPGSTATDFLAVAGAPHAVTSGAMMPPAQVARQSCRGLVAGRRVVITGWRNRVFAVAAKMTPHAVSLPITHALRRRALRG